MCDRALTKALNFATPTNEIDVVVAKVLEFNKFIFYVYKN